MRTMSGGSGRARTRGGSRSPMLTWMLMFWLRAARSLRSRSTIWARCGSLVLTEVDVPDRFGSVVWPVVWPCRVWPVLLGCALCGVGVVEGEVDGWAAGLLDGCVLGGCCPR